MLSAIKGELFEINPGEVFLETPGGLIVKVLCPVSSYSEIKKNKSVFLYTTMGYFSYLCFKTFV